MSHTPQDRDGDPGAHAPETLAQRSLFVRVNVVAVAVAAAGLFLPRVTSAGGYGLATAHTGYGQVFGLLLLFVCVALAGWYATRADWLTAALLFVVWLGLLATAAFEVVRVSSFYSGQVGLADVGVGLYCNAAGAAIGAAMGAIEAVREWSCGRGNDGSGRLPWLAAVTAAVVILAAVAVTGQMAGREAQVRSAAGFSSPHKPYALGAPARDQSPVEGHHVVTAPGSGTTTPSAGAVAGPSGASATPSTLGGSGATGATVAGDSGNSGDWGMDGGLATYWPGYVATPGSYYIWPGYLGGPATNTGATGGSGSTVTGATGLTGSGTGATGTGSTGPAANTTTSVPASSAPRPLVAAGERTA